MWAVCEVNLLEPQVNDALLKCEFILGHMKQSSRNASGCLRRNDMIADGRERVG